MEKKGSSKIIYPEAEVFRHSLSEWSEGNAKNFQVKSLCQLFEEQAFKHPSNIALEYQDQTLSYQALNEITNQLARTIRYQYFESTGKALEPDTLIPISTKRGIDYVIGILGILKAGAAYVPINPEYPDARIQFILEDIQSSLILTLSKFSEKFNQYKKNMRQIALDEKKFLEESCLPLEVQPCPNDLAYVIYTSGSTGVPKGVLAQHNNVISQVICANYFEAGILDAITFFSDVSFDSTTFEIWGALLNGSKLFIPDNLFELLSNPILFKETIKKRKITIVLLTRSLFDMLYSLDETVFTSLKFLLVGGEALTKAIMLKLFHSKYKPSYLINAYGPTENSTFCTTNTLIEDFSPYTSVPIGKPYSNRIVYVVDRHLQLLPLGVVGEICVGGPSLSRGYLNQPKLTEERFIHNPFFDNNDHSNYRRIYKTGDLGKWLANGNLECIGRNDFQVKLRGFRIELGEIETRLLEFPGVQHCVVLLKNKLGLDYLVGYYVANEKIAPEALRAQLEKKLPDYMIPTVFQHLQTLPVTTNGKLDRKSLPEPDYEIEVDSQLIISTSFEKTIFEVWSKVLSVKPIERDASFFNLGGNSLAAMMVRNELEKIYGIKINIVELFEHTTLRQLAERLPALIKEKDKNENEKRMPERPMDKIIFNKETEFNGNEPIAVVGMACRLPGVKDPESFWDLLIHEDSNIRELSNEELRKQNISECLISNDTYVKRDAVFADKFNFDASFFGCSVKEAEMMDPQQRHFLECAWEALEYSGNVPEKFNGDIGVFASQGPNHYYMDYVYPYEADMSAAEIFQSTLCNEKDFLSTRVSYKLNLTGPSITLQTACSSSLVSIQMACESLKTKGCDMALAGGVSLFYKPGYTYQEEMIESPDGYCRAFDAKAKGTIVTSGVGVVVLKRLSDAILQKDSIYAVIKGGAINNDGSSKIGFTAPSVQGQMAVIEKALKNSAVTPEKIGYIEAHGTGTPLGDPIEWAALHQVYQKYTNKKEFCRLGSVKTNIGHTDAAAGVMGFIKTVLSLKYKTIPATLYFETLNPEIASFNTLFWVNNRTMKWESPNETRRAAISSFGLGGTNAHLVLEEYCDNNPEITDIGSNVSHFLIPFSAKNRRSLSLMAEKIKQEIETNQSNLSSYAFTAQQGRSEFNVRGFFLFERSTTAEAMLISEEQFISEGQGIKCNENLSVVFVWSELSQGVRDQYYKIYHQDVVFKSKVDLVQEKILKKSEVELNRNNLFDFAMQYTLTELLIARGLSPEDVFVPSMFDNFIKKVAFQNGTKLYQDEFCFSQKNTVFIELGAKKYSDQTRDTLSVVSENMSHTEAMLLKIIGWLWIRGYPISWSHFIKEERPVRKIKIPTYIFEHENYKMAILRPSDLSSISTTVLQESEENDALTEDAIRNIWSKILGISATKITPESNFFELGGDSLGLIDLFTLIKKRFIPHLKMNDIVYHNQFDAMSKHLIAFVGKGNEVYSA